MRPVQFTALSEVGNVESFMRRIRSAYFVLNRRAPETVLDLANMSLGLLRELLGQELELQGRHAVPKPEGEEVTEIKDEDGEVKVYVDSRPVEQSRRE